MRRARVPKDLEDLWLGHAKQSIGDFYAVGLANDEKWRREWCDRAGLGLDLVQNVVEVASEEAA